MFSKEDETEKYCPSPSENVSQTLQRVNRSQSSTFNRIVSSIGLRKRTFAPSNRQPSNAGLTPKANPPAPPIDLVKILHQESIENVKVDGVDLHSTDVAAEDIEFSKCRVPTIVTTSDHYTRAIGGPGDTLTPVTTPGRSVAHLGQILIPANRLDSVPSDPTGYSQQRPTDLKQSLHKWGSLKRLPGFLRKMSIGKPGQSNPEVGESQAALRLRKDFATSRVDTIDPSDEQDTTKHGARKRFLSSFELNSFSRQPSSPEFGPRFSGNPLPLLGTGDISSIGLEDINGVFAFDQLNQLFCFAMIDGNLKLCSPDYELHLPNDLENVSITHLVMIPGFNRCITVGIQQLKSNESSTWSHSIEDPTKRNILQVWDFSQVFPHSPKTLGTFRPITIELAYRVSCMQRIQCHRTMDPSRLYRQCRKRTEVAVIENDRPSDRSASSSLHPSRSQAKSARSDTSGPSVGTGPTRLDIAARYFTHPDNTRFPCGDPSTDSRWLILIGTFEGDVRLFDGWECEFLDYLISGENVCQQIMSQTEIASSFSSTFHIDRLVSLPIVRSLSPHPNDPSLLLIGYSNGLVVQWYLSRHIVSRCYLPTSAHSVPADSPSSSLQFVDSSQSPYTKTIALGIEASPPSSHSDTLLIPNSYDSLQFPIFLHSVAWHPSGTAFVIAVSAFGMSDQGYSPSSLSLMVFTANYSFPVAIVSLEHVIRESLSDFFIPFLLWENLDKSIRAVGQTNTVALMSGRLFLLLSPITTILYSEIQIASLWNSSRVSWCSSPTASPYGRTAPSLRQFHEYVRSETVRRPPANLWKLSGNLWSDGHPVFPSGFAGIQGNRLGFTSAEVVAPSLQQTSLGNEFPAVVSLCGLGFPSDLDTDQGEDADTIIGAAKKLSQFLLAGTFVLVLSEQPVRQVLGACLKIDHEKFTLLSHIFPNIVPKVASQRQQSPSESRDSRSPSDFDSELSDNLPHSQTPSGGSRAITSSPVYSNSSGSSEDYEGDDFSPWDTMSKPVCFHVDWQSLSISHVSSLISIPRFFRPSIDVPFGLPSPPLPIYRLSSNGLCWTTTDPQSKRYQNTSDYSGSHDSKQFDSLDSFVDVLYTLKKKHIVHGWLTAMLGSSHKSYLAVIPQKFEPVAGKSAEKSGPKGRSRHLSSDADDVPTSSDHSDYEDEFDEWRCLNEIRFFGDLLRISSSKWGFETSEVSVYKGIVITGHTDGKLKLWAQTIGGLILLHTLSIIATDCLMPTENESPKRITDDGNVPDRADLFTIASIDARPIIPLIPEVPIITCIHAYIPGYDPYNGIIQQTVLDGPRYIIAGCISGEVIVFKWNSDAVTLPPLETKEFMKRQTRRSFASIDTEESLINFESSAAQLRMLLPFGFTCISRILRHSAHITALHVATIELAGDDEELRGQPERIKPGLLSSIGLRPQRKPPTQLPIEPSTNESSKSTNLCRLFIGDSNGSVSCVELPSGRVLSTTYASGTQQGSSHGPVSTFKTQTMEGGVTNLLSNIRGVHSFSCISRPLLSPHQQSSSKYENTEVASGSPTTGSRYVMVTYISGVVRVFDCLSSRFLDEEGGGSRFITRLDSIDIPMTRSDAINVPSSGPIRSRRTSAEETTGGQLKVVLLTELRVDFADYLRMCQFHQRRDPDWPLIRSLDLGASETVSSRVSSRIAWTASKQPRQLDSSICCFICVTSYWIGLLEYRYIETSPTSVPFTPRNICGIDLQRESLFASLSFMDDLPVVTVHFKGGYIELYTVYFNHDSEIVCALLSSLDTLNNLSPSRKRHVLSQSNWSSGDWNGNITFGRRNADHIRSPVYFSSIIETSNTLKSAWNKEAWNRLAHIVILRCQQLHIKHYRKKKYKSDYTFPSTLAAPPEFVKRHKGWASNLVTKFSQWATDYAKPESQMATLHFYIKSAPRECLCTSRDQRLRGREKSSRRITRSSHSSLRRPSVTATMGDGSEQPSLPKFVDSSMSSLVRTDLIPSSASLDESHSEDTCQPVFSSLPPLSPTETGRSVNRRKSQWSSIFSSGLSPSAVPPELKKAGRHKTEETTSTDRGKVDPWEAAERAKQKLEENLEMTRQTAAKAEETNQNARIMLDLSKALAQKYR